MKLIRLYGTRNWSIIAASVPGRSGKSCRLRCVRASCCASKTWSEVYAIAVCWRHHHAALSRHNQLRAYRWHNQLNPEVKKDPFSEWEDAVIVQVWGPVQICLEATRTVAVQLTLPT